MAKETLRDILHIRGFSVQKNHLQHSRQDKVVKTIFKKSYFAGVSITVTSLTSFSSEFSGEPAAAVLFLN